jgi:membrane protein
MNRKEFLELVKTSFHKWHANNATIRAAALAFFIILPLPSVLLLTVLLYSQFYGATQGTEQLLSQIQVLAGATIADLVGQLLEGVTNTFTSVFNSLLSIVFAVAGAAGAFVVLQDTFNLVWEVHRPKGRSLKTKVRERLAPFILVLFSTVIVVGWLEYTTLLFGSLSDAIGVTGTFVSLAFFFVVQLLFSFASAAVLFGIIFKEIPDVKIEWGDVWIGAVITAVVFTILNNVFGFYLRTFPVTSVTGAAGSIIVLLIWIFVIAEALMYGAQFSKCYADTFGSHSNRKPHRLYPVELQAISKELEKVESKLNPKPSTHVERKEAEALEHETKEPEHEPTVTNEPQNASVEAREVELPAAQKNEGHEPSAKVVFEQTESADASEKEYKFEVKWKQKKKGSNKSETDESSSETSK